MNSSVKKVDDSQLQVYTEGCKKILNRIHSLYTTYAINEIEAIPESFQISGFKVATSNLEKIKKRLADLYDELQTQIKKTDSTIENLKKATKDAKDQFNKGSTDLSKYTDQQLANLIWTGVFNYSGAARVKFLGNRYAKVQAILNEKAKAAGLTGGSGSTKPNTGSKQTTGGTKQNEKVTKKVQETKKKAEEQKKQTEKMKTDTIPKKTEETQKKQQETQKKEETKKTDTTPQKKEETQKTQPETQKKEETKKPETTPQKKEETQKTQPETQKKEEPNKTETIPQQKSEERKRVIEPSTIQPQTGEPPVINQQPATSQQQTVIPQPTQQQTVIPQPAPAASNNQNISTAATGVSSGVTPTVSVAQPEQAQTPVTTPTPNTTGENTKSKIDFTAGNKKTTVDTELPNPNASSGSSKTTTSSGGGFNPVPIAVGLGAAVAGGIGVKAVVDHRKNSKFNDENEDSVTNGNRFWTDEEPNVINSEQNYSTGEELFDTSDAANNSYQATENSTTGNDTWSIEENEISDDNTFDLLSENN